MPSEIEEVRGDVARRAGLAARARRVGHRRACDIVAEEPPDLAREAHGVGRFLADAHGASGARQRLGVARLVVVGGVREGNEDCSAPHGRDLGDRARAGAGDDQVGLGHGARDVVDERHDGRHARTLARS